MEVIPPVAYGQQPAKPSTWVRAGMAFNVILLIPWRSAKLHDIRCVFTVSICYEDIRLLLLVTSRSTAEWDFSACSFIGGSNHYAGLKAEVLLRSHPDVPCRQGNTDHMLVAFPTITLDQTLLKCCMRCLNGKWQPQPSPAFCGGAFRNT